MNGEITIHVLHCGEVCVAPGIPFGEGSLLKASGVFTPKAKRLWLPVSAYLIEHPKGLILTDCGWHREMSPAGDYDEAAQIKHLSYPLFKINQGKIPLGAAVDEQLRGLGIETSDLDYVLLTHLDCDHVSGLKLVSDAKNILVSSDELKCAERNKLIRYRFSMWEGVPLGRFEFYNDGLGPFNRSYDLFDDGSVILVNIPGHSDGLFAILIRRGGHYVLLFSDGGYSSRSWREMILPGISLDRAKFAASLEWIREMSLNYQCIESLANHDPEIEPHIISL